MPGGPANKVGNRYERRWTVLKLFDVLTGDADYIEIEALGEEDHGAEFVLMRDSTLEWHQVKLQHKDGDWTIARLNEKRVLARWWPKLQAGDRWEFVSETTARQLDFLTKRARAAGSWSRFNAIIGNGDHRRHYDRVREAWGNPPDEEAFLALRQIKVTGINEEQLECRLLDRAALVLNGDPAAMVRHLSEIVDESLHRPMTARDIERIIAQQKGLRINRNTSDVRYWQLSAVGREADISASASVQDPRDNNCVSLSVNDGDVPGADRASGDGNGNASPGSRRRRIARHSVAFLAGLIVMAGTLVAADRVWSLSGVPEYFQTGPGAGIKSSCDNKPPMDGLVSPQADVFTNVSQWSQISVDGRSAYVMRGTFNGAIYHWVISDFNAYGMPNFKGTPGAAQIHWWLNGGKSQYCIISFLNTPPADLAQEATRQVSTMAIPANIDGKPAFIQVCVWYKPQKLPKKRCWPPS